MISQFINFTAHGIGYNRQDNNYNFGRRFMGWNQCFVTCSWMLMSFYTKEIDATDDLGLSVYLDDVENSIGKPGIGEIVKLKYNWIRGNTSYWWLVQKEGIEKWLWGNGIKGNAIFKEKLNFNKLYNLLIKGPVILGTKKIGGLKTGHIILLAGSDGVDFLVKDPFGNANKKYTDKNGDNIIYDKEMLMKHAGEKVTCMYWRS